MREDKSEAGGWYPPVTGCGWVMRGSGRVASAPAQSQRRARSRHPQRPCIPTPDIANSFCAWLLPSRASPPPCSPRAAAAAAACQAHSRRPCPSPTRPTVRPMHKGPAREQERQLANGYVRGGCVRKWR
eukprot:scaffold68239_cov55-Phaeocystis_antarctica.AAC.1